MLALFFYLGVTSLCSCKDGVEEVDVPRDIVQIRVNMPLFMLSNDG